ncbi:MAG: tetratricopeptide repeat protein [Candidatus Binataceae bacterium]
MAMLRGRLAFMTGLVMAVAVSACSAVHQDRAQQYFAQGRYDEAANEVQAALAKDPNNLEVDQLAAKIFTQQGYQRYKRNEMISASQDFQRAIDYYPTYAPAYDYLGLTAFSQGNWQDAVKYGSAAAGYSGQPEPLYVQQAREQLRRVRSGQPFFPSRNRTP